MTGMIGSEGVVFAFNLMGGARSCVTGRAGAHPSRLFCGAADVVFEDEIRAMFALVDNELVHEAAEEGVVADDGIGHLLDDEADLRRELALAAIVAAGREGVGADGDAVAVFKTHVAGLLAFRQHVAVLSTTAEEVARDGGGGHVQRAKP